MANADAALGCAPVSVRVAWTVRPRDTSRTKRFWRAALPGVTRLVAADWNNTKRPSGVIWARLAVAFGTAPPTPTEAMTVTGENTALAGGATATVAARPTPTDAPN